MLKPSRTTVIAATLTTTAALALPLSSAASAADDRSEELQQDVTLQGVMQHIEKFQEIADANGGNRAAGLPGYAASSDYVAERMREAGYVVEQREFVFPFFQETAKPVMEEVAPEQQTFAEQQDFSTMTFSGSGDVTAPVAGVDLALDPPRDSTSGCEESDFTGFPKGAIALIQRGACTFGLKAQNAEAAGAVGVILFNQGNTEARMDAFSGTLGGNVVKIPVVGASFAVGQDLAAPANPDTKVHMDIETVSEQRTTTNVIAETQGGNPNNVVMLGAHLDSVPEGAGINDNGSGSAAILEVAEEMADVNPVNKVRFAWWGAEELGLIGSEKYVASLSERERDQIALYMNFDMVGSPNFIRGVYDGDGSSFGLKGPEGSKQIEALFNEHFESEGLPYQATEFSGRSDYQAFISNDIPSGGLFTGADGTKTEAEEQTYGGVAGAILDPCYHQKCDSTTPLAHGADKEVYAELKAENNLIGNIAPEALNTNADAIAHAAITYGFDVSDVEDPGPDQPATPEQAQADAEGRGGPDHAHQGAKR